MAFLKGYTDETLLNEVDGMTDMLYEKQGSYLQGKDDKAHEVAKAMLVNNEPIEKIKRYSLLSENDILEIRAQLESKS